MPISNMTTNRPKDPVVDTPPEEWNSEQEMLAKEALRVLYRHYRGWKWGVEFSENVGGQMGSMIIRLLDVPTETIYVINYKDIDKDRMYCAVTAGGMMLEAHGISRKFGAFEEIKGLKATPSGILVPEYAAVPENNPGYEKIKGQHLRLRG